MCIVIPHSPRREDMIRAVGQVAAQTHRSLSCVIVGGEGPIEGGADGRFTRLPGDGSRPIQALRELCRLRAEPHLLWLDSRDELAPGAIRAMLDAAGNSRSGAAIGRYAFWSRLGVIPGDPMSGVGDRLMGDEWLGRCVAPTHAVLVPRSMLAGVIDRANDWEAWDWRLWLALAAKDVDWRVSRETVAAFSLRAGAPAEMVMRGVLARVSLVESASRSAGAPISVRTALLTPWAQAAAVLQCAVEFASERGPEALHAETRFPEMYARWWHRLGFLGPPPRHVLTGHGGLEHCFVRWPEAIARAMVDAAAAVARVVVVGLGRNGRAVARELHRRGRKVIGLDEGLTGPPTWTGEDGVRVEQLSNIEAIEPGSCCLVTPWSDALLVERLPKGATVIRWSTMPTKLAAAAISTVMNDAGSSGRPLEAAA